MKIFVVEGNYPQYNIIDGASLDDKVERPKTAINLLPDTALLMRGRPFFVPDFAWPCMVQEQLLRPPNFGLACGPRACPGIRQNLLMGLAVLARFKRSWKKNGKI